MVFLCGSLRSGTSLIGLMLNQHPRIHNPGELDFLFDQITPQGQTPDIDEYHTRLKTERIFQVSNLSIDHSLGYQELIASFMQQMSADDSELVINIHRCFDRIPDVLPDAKFIHLIRDPRDVARSSIGMGWAGNVYHGVDHWIDSERDWKALQQKLSPDQYLQIRYEDLILSPPEVLAEICAFVGVDYDEQMLEYDRDSTYGKPDPALVAQWKTKLTRREIEHVESKVPALMNEYGYHSDGQQPAVIGLVEKIKLKISNKIFKWRFAIDRYGLKLQAKDKLSTVLSSQSMREQVYLEKKMIDINYLK